MKAGGCVLVWALMLLAGTAMAARPVPRTSAAGSAWSTLGHLARALGESVSGTRLVQARFGLFRAADSRSLVSRSYLIPDLIGNVAIVLGVIPSLFQFYKNFQLKTGTAISMDMIAFRGAGCVVNWIGAMLCAEPFYTVLLNFYFCLETSFYFFQALHYVRRSGYRGPALRVSPWAVTGAALIALTPVVVFGLGAMSSVPTPALVDRTGTVSLWVSNLIFVVSRLPQMYQAWRLKSVAGVSAMMYVTLIIGNVANGASILVRNLIDRDPLWKMLAGSSAAIFLGTFGPVVLDLAYLGQMARYGPGPVRPLYHDHYKRLDDGTQETSSSVPLLTEIDHDQGGSGLDKTPSV